MKNIKIELTEEEVDEVFNFMAKKGDGKLVAFDAFKDFYYTFVAKNN